MEKKEVILLVMIVCFVLSMLFYYSFTVPENERISKLDLMTDHWEISHPKFNYIFGLWLMPMGLFFIFLLVFLDMPSFGEIYRHLKCDFKKKIFEGLNFHKKS